MADEEWTSSYVTTKNRSTKYTLERVNSEILGSKRQTIEWLIEHRLLSPQPTCDTCRKLMKLAAIASNSDGFRWQCRNDSAEGKHRVVKSVRRHSWFEGSRLTLGELMTFAYYWSHDLPLTFISHETGLSMRTLVDWAKFKREICQETMIKIQKPIGGPGIHVEVGESRFGKRSNIRGCLREGQLLFGVCERDDQSKFSLICVENWDAETLLGLIAKWVVKGSIIHSDKAKVYDRLPEMGYMHLTASQFVDADTGASMSHIENVWRHAKKSLPRYGARRYLLTGYLAEHAWRQQTEVKDGDPFLEILRAIANIYNRV